MEPEHAHSLAVEHARTSHMNGCNRVAWVKKSPTMTPFDLRFGLAFLDHVPTFLGRYWPSQRVCPSQQVNGSSSRFSLRRVRSDVRSQEPIVHALLHVPYLVGGNGEVGLRTYLASKQTNVVFPLVRSGLLFRHTPGSQQTI